MKKRTVIFLLSVILVLAAGAVSGVVYLYSPAEKTGTSVIQEGCPDESVDKQQNDIQKDTVSINKLP